MNATHSLQHEACTIRKRYAVDLSGVRWQAEDPTRLDQIRVFYWRCVGFHDLCVSAALALAVMHLGNLPERVTLLHGVHLRLGSRALHLQVARVDLRYTNAVAQ